VHRSVQFFRFVFNWNILVPFDCGTIEVEDQGAVFNVKFRASTFRMLKLTFGMSIGFAIFAFVGGAPPRIPALMFVMAWIWLFGGNYVLAAIRFPLWLRRALKRA